MPKACLEEIFGCDIISPFPGLNDYMRTWCNDFPYGFAEGMYKKIELITQLKYARFYDRNLDRFNNQIVVDLGAGKHSYAYRIAKLLEARAYVGIEPYWASELEESLSEEDEKSPDNALLWAVVPAGMLHFVDRIPDDSVSFFAFGIDGMILLDHGYSYSVNRLLSRVLHPDGAAFFWQSTALRVNNVNHFKKFLGLPICDLYTK